MSEQQPASGDELTPNLRLVRALGRGGMGVLWIAEHRTLGTDVVVKFLSDERSGDRSAAKLIAREAAAAAQVKSPHVVQVFDHGVSERGQPFIVMERLTGCDLRTFLEERGALPVDVTLTIIRQLAKALGKTHAAGFVHQDVKPSNIFLCDFEGEIFVKLLDFGLARRSLYVQSSSTGSPHCAGTPPYMSPEQIIGCPVDARSDIWSLGVVAFECLTGKRAFEGETLGAFALAIHTLSPPSVTGVRPELPAEVDGWFARACARSREERFASATEAAEAMATALRIDVSPTRLRPTIPARFVGDRTLTDDFALTRAQARRPAGPRPMRVASIAGLALTAAAILWAARADQSAPRRVGHASAKDSDYATMPRPEEPVDIAPSVPRSGQPLTPIPTTVGPAAPVASTHGPTQAVKQEGRAPASPRAHATPASPTAPAVNTRSHIGRLDEVPDERY